MEGMVKYNRFESSLRLLDDHRQDLPRTVEQSQIAFRRWKETEDAGAQLGEWMKKMLDPARGGSLPNAVQH